MISRLWILILFVQVAFSRCETDQLTENVENFALESLQRISDDHNLSLTLGDTFVSSYTEAIFNISGILSDNVLIGLNSLTNIKTLVRSLTIAQYVNLEYSFIIPSPTIHGRYNFSGYIGSSMLPFNGIGNYQINLAHPINISCTIAFNVGNGFIALNDNCFSVMWNINVTNAQFDFEGIVDHPLLDAELTKNVLELIVDVATERSLSHDISNEIFYVVNRVLRENFLSTKLMDIILMDPTKRMNASNLNTVEVSDNGQATVRSKIENRLCNFVTKSMESFLDSIDDPYPLGSNFYLDSLHSALFPSSGILSNLTLSTFRNLSTLTCSSRVNFFQTTFNLGFEMSEVILSGDYHITGSIVGETPVNQTGQFSIQSIAGGRFELTTKFRNVNGHLVLDWTPMYEFKVLSDTLRTSLLPSPFDGIELRQEIAGKIIDSIGWAALCTPESFCSLTFIAAPLVRMMEEYLQDVFTDASIVDIVTKVREIE